MSSELAIILVLLAVAIVMFAINKPRMDVVALIMLTVLPFTGIITMGEALAGFSDPNVILIAALFVIGDGLVRTGVARALGDWLLARAGASETHLLVLLMLIVAALGATMSSTAVTAIFIPVVLRISRSTNSSPSRLMMPLSFAALISGMLTLVATAPNLVVNSELQRHGVEGLGFFSFTPFGLPILALGIVYMLFARRWLAERVDDSTRARRRPSLSEWIEQYKLTEREHRVRVTPKSPLVGRSLAELNLRSSSGASIVAVDRYHGRFREVLQPTAKLELQANDILLIDLFASDGDIAGIREQFALEQMPLSGAYFNDRSQEIGMAEVMLSNDSSLIGKTIVESQVRTRFGLTVVGLRRGRTAHEQGLLQERLQLGDTLLLVGPWRYIERLPSESDDLTVLQLPIELDDVLPVTGRAPHAVAILLLVVALMVSGWVPNVQAALLGCLLMGAFGCISITSAYRAIDWKTIILIVGMLPFSVALHKTGGDELAADALTAVVGGAGTYVILAAIFAITTTLGMFISNTATAVLMAPVAFAVSEELNASPYPFVMIVALAASTAFMTPVSSPVNTLVVTPGNYRFGDFVRIGTPFALIVLVVSVLLVPLLLPL